MSDQPSSLDRLGREVSSDAEVEALIRASWANVGVLDTVPILSPGMERPTHLRPMATVFRSAEAAAHGEGKPVLALLSAPPQIGKTLTGQHACARWLARHPTDFLAYLTYGQDLASEKSKQIRALARDAGVRLRTDSTAADLWRTEEGGGMLARGLDAGVTGHSGLAFVWIDDPYKGVAQAESSKERRSILEGIRSNVFSRISPRTSVLISHTRWHSDDVIGVLSRELADRFQVIKLAACTEDGEPLITLGGRDRAFYEQQRALSEHNWHSLYMGEPRPREGKRFQGTTFYTAQPNELRVAIGVDFAYSKRTSSDWSTAVVLGREDHRRYVLRVIRKRCLPTEFAADLRALSALYPGAPMHSYIGGQEGGILDLLRTQGVYITGKPATADKYSRALPASAAWNAGNILVPDQSLSIAPADPWIADFVAEVLDFSGVNDDHDDQVDALVGAFDALGIDDQQSAGPYRDVVVRRAWEAREDVSDPAAVAAQRLRIKRRWE